MADISLIEDVCMDDCDEGVYEQADCSTGSSSSSDDDALPPLSRVQKYAQAGNVYDRQMVARVVQDLFRTAPADVLTEELPNIMDIVRNLGEKDDPMVRADLLEQIPHMAQQAVTFSSRVEILNTVISEYLIPLVVRNLGGIHNTVDKAAHTALLHLMDQGLITKPQVEIQVCPAILALSYEEQTVDINIRAIALMCKLAPLLGRDVVERVFLKRFSQLCSSPMFHIRKVCASHIWDFCAVVGKDQFEKVLLPCYIALCQDEIWGVRKSCAEVAMFVSLVCPQDVRRGTLATVFARLLQDDCRWVQMSAFQTLGPFISTFADPPITSATYNTEGELVFVNKNGDEFMMNTPDVRFSKYLGKQLNRTTNSNDSSDWWGLDEEDTKLKIERENLETMTTELDGGEQSTSSAEIEEEEDSSPDLFMDFVKIALLGRSTVNKQEIDVIGDNLSNANVISNIKNETCDNLGSTIMELNDDLKTMSLETYDPINIESSTSSKENQSGDTSTNNLPELNQTDDNCHVQIVETKAEDIDVKECAEEKIDENKVNTNSQNTESENEDDLHMFNSYHYWYITPDILIDLNNVSGGQSSQDQLVDNVIGARLEDMYCTINQNDILSLSNALQINQDETGLISESDSSTEVTELVPVEMEQDIVPHILISHFILMTDSGFAINIDNEMSYHCAYSLPAVALTLENKNWPLLKRTIERLASDMQYKVRRTVASSLHELAIILGRDIATEHLTPIFEGFIKDLDEVRIGILKHLAYFLRIIKPAKRLTYLPMLQEFLKTENDWNWRFRHELAKQLLFIVTLFKPVDSVKHIGFIAEVLLHDVSAVRQVAISLITELLRHISTKPGLNTHFLVRLVERYAHSKMWKRRQTFALLCYKLLSCKALPTEQFASEIMPHLLDLSWDPVANVRLVVAKTIAQHIIPNEYFADPSNQYFDSLGTVLRRLQADKDRDVRQYAEVCEPSEKSMSPTPALDYNID